LQAYNTTNDTWESLGINNVFPGLYTADNSLNIGNIYFAERADANTANNLYTYTIIGGTTTGPHTGYEILQMNPQYDLMLVETNTGYSVLSVSTTSIHSFNDIFHTNYKPRLISQANTQFIVSGRNTNDSESVYVHYYLVGTTSNELTTTTDTTFDDYPIVAMMMTSTNFLVVINSLGDVWAMDTTASTYNSFNLVGRIPNFPDDRDPADMPYPIFINADTLILQNENNVFYGVTDIAITELENITNVSTTEPTDYSILVETLKNIQVKSYLVDSGTLYVGTMQNGIFSIDIPSDSL
jgi:hypothetical protein